MSDLIGSPTVTPAPAVSNITTSELARFAWEDVREASIRTWSVADHIPPETAARLANLAEVRNQIDNDQA